MGKEYPADIIPDFGAPFPPGAALVRIESLDDSEPTSTGKYQIRAVLRGMEPADVVDQPHFERFVIGRDQDPEADDPQSWKGIAAQRYRDMLLKAGVQPTGNVEKDNAEATGQVLGIVVQNETQAATNRDGTPNAYAGRLQANLRTFFRQGEKAIGGPAPAPVAAPAVATAPKVVAAAPKVATPAPAAAPTPQAAPKTASVKCSICNEMVPRAAFPAHVQAHEVADE